MAPSMSRTSAGGMLLLGCALLTSSLLLFFGTGLQPIWWFTWFAPFPVLWVAPRIGGLPAFAMAALSWFAGGLNLWHYLVGLIQIPLGVFLGIVSTSSLFFGLAVLTHRAFMVRGFRWRAALSFPALWVTFEYLTSITSPHSTFGNIAYSQMDLLPLLQFASVAGIWGISFCLWLFAATLAVLVGNRWGKTGNGRLAAAAGGFLVAVVLYGSWRLHSAPQAAHQATVAMMSSDLPENIFTQNDAATLKLFHGYSEQIAQLPEPFGRDSRNDGSLVIVLPEKIGILSDAGTEEMDRLFKSVAAQAKASIVVGVDRGTRTQRSNDARLYSPQGGLQAVYRKHHLIPGVEGVDQSGTQRVLLDQPSGIWGLEICKDMDFPHLSREYGEDGAGLLLVPAWDFVIDGWLHNRMAVMRGVESGFTIARTAKQGLLTVSDDRGRLLAQASSSGLPFSSLLATAPVWHDMTLYDRWGDWFAWLNIAALVALLASLIRKRHSPFVGA